MIELFPEGFEEIDRHDGVELVAYTDAGGEEQMWRAFGGARGNDVGTGWEERWREFHRPIRVGDLWIGQPWQEAPAEAVTVVIDPGRAFGTGAHATTRLTLELITGLERGSLLDVGCGSGVLSIAAAKLGFGPVTAIDVESVAVAAARKNADANAVDVDVVEADAQTAVLPAADVAVANLTRELVDAVVPRLNCRQLVTSGYLVSDDVLLDGYRHIDRRAESGWAADLFERQ